MFVPDNILRRHRSIGIWPVEGSCDAAMEGEVRAALARSTANCELLHALANVAAHEEYAANIACGPLCADSTVVQIHAPRRARSSHALESYVHVFAPLVPRGAAAASEASRQQERVAELAAAREVGASGRDGPAALKMWYYCAAEPPSAFPRLHAPADFRPPRRQEPAEEYAKGQYLFFVARDTLVHFLRTQIAGYSTQLVCADFAYGFDAHHEPGWRTGVHFTVDHVNVLRRRLETDVVDRLHRHVPAGAFVALPGVLVGGEGDGEGEGEGKGEGKGEGEGKGKAVDPRARCTVGAAAYTRHASMASEHLTVGEMSQFIRRGGTDPRASENTWPRATPLASEMRGTRVGRAGRSGVPRSATPARRHRPRPPPSRPARRAPTQSERHLSCAEQRSTHDSNRPSPEAAPLRD